MSRKFADRFSGRAIQLRGSVLLLAAAFFLASLPVMAAASFSYLTQATNEIDAIYHGSADLSNEDSARIAKIACDAMVTLTKDPQFEKSVQYFLDRRSKENGAAARDLIVDLKKFSDVFLKNEQMQLDRQGLSLLTAIDTLSYAAWRRNRGDIQDVAAVNPAEAIASFRDAVCKLSEKSAGRIEARPIVFGIFGVAMIVVDLVGEFETAGLSTASVGLGGAIVYDAAKDIAK
jgi:hypothetical protein